MAVASAFAYYPKILVRMRTIWWQWSVLKDPLVLPSHAWLNHYGFTRLWLSKRNRHTMSKDCENQPENNDFVPQLRIHPMTEDHGLSAPSILNYQS